MGDNDKAAQYSEIWSGQQCVCLHTQIHILMQYSYLVCTQFISLTLIYFILHYLPPNFLLLLHFRLLNMQKVLMHCSKNLQSITWSFFLWISISYSFHPLIKSATATSNFWLNIPITQTLKKCPKEQVIAPAALLLLFLSQVLLWAINEIVHHLINWTDWLKIFLVNKESVLGELTWNLFQVVQPVPITTDTKTLCLRAESKFMST